MVRDVTLSLIVTVPAETDPDDVASTVTFALEDLDRPGWDVSETTVTAAGEPYGIA